MQKDTRNTLTDFEVGEIENPALAILKQWDAMSTYIEIESPIELRALIADSKKITEISLDTETTGIDTITAQALGYSFSFKEHVAYWVPMKIDPQMKLLNQLLKKKTVIFFNAGYDLAIVEKYGVPVPEDKIVDIMIACFFRDINGYHRNAGLKAQAETLLLTNTVGLKEIIAANTGVKTV